MTFTIKHPVLTAFAILCALGNAQERPYTPEKGDLYFQSLPPTPLSATIEGATRSPYSHCGILNQKDGEWVMHEAIGPVRVTKLTDWIQQGEGDQFDVFRLRDQYRSRIDDLLLATERYTGRPYDILYDFDDEKIYCSELIFKSFKEVFDEDLGVVVTLGDLDWKPYKSFIRSIDPSLPLSRKMITPKHLPGAVQLEQVYGLISQPDATQAQ